jgi:hypothetical protein
MHFLARTISELGCRVKTAKNRHLSCCFSEVHSPADAAVVLPMAEFGSEAVAEIKKATSK